MDRPDIEAILAPLKPFQRRTVDHAFHRLFEAPDSTARFLVADEVGLGKTLVARGIIGRAIEHLWDRVDRIDIIYICSNGSIARANLPKLQVGSMEDRAFALATRLTMLATQLAPQEGAPGIIDSKLNFVSFTPATSFEMGNSGGQAQERVVLFNLLEPLVGRRKPLMNFLQGRVSDTDRWRARLNNQDIPIDPTIRRRFETAFRRQRKLRSEVDELLETWFARTRKHWPKEARRWRKQLTGKLRHLLAEVCIQALEPDLVILDEFQRFKSLLETDSEQRNPAAELAHALFRAQTPEGHPVRTLLLSATPYKLYTADAEIEQEDHYADFLATTRFLMDDDDVQVATLKSQLAGFGSALKRAASTQANQVGQAKAAVESTLRKVMARTERVAASADRDAMVEEPNLSLQLATGDVQQYLAADALFRAVDDRDPIAFWKSAPYLVHFMRGYKFNERLEETSQHVPCKVTKVLREHAPAFLKAPDVLAWSEIGPANAKLRELIRDLIAGGLWQLLWIPPTVPYWPLEGPFRGQAVRTKTLLFSAWNVVPDVVSAVLSYEAERHMMGGRLQSYQDPASQQVPRLRLTQSASGARTRHRLFVLLLPCLTLADSAHPLAAPQDIDRRQWVRERVEALLADPRIPNPTEGNVDERWEWAAPLVLDPALKDFLATWCDDETLPRPNPELFSDYLNDLLALDPQTLGRRPENLAELLTEVALGSPAIAAARTAAITPISDQTRRRIAVEMAEPFWRLFNRPAVIALLDQLDREETDLAREEGYYWRSVLRYCREGNLQAVLDETWHLMWEQRAWSEHDANDPIAQECATELAALINPTPSRVHAHFYTENGAGQIEKTEIRLRTTFALRFGDIRTEEREVNQDTVRAMFNSPFRPFVLTSTSVGQEGLDFHPWCHRLVHWDLPGNPVDLEQREGRVHRYKGHAVRRNIADMWKHKALARCRPGDDLWQILFDIAEKAARNAGDSDLIPLWISRGKHRIQRHVPLLPYSKEVEVFRRLKRQLAAYRVVFGQPRQEEMMLLLDKSDLDVELLREWAVDLTPPVGVE